MDKRAKALLDKGWYRACGGWWHKDLGIEPETYIGGKTLKDAISIENKWKKLTDIQRGWFADIRRQKGRRHESD